MKNAFRAAAVLVVVLAALIFSVPANAQWHDNDSCNRNLNSGFKNTHNTNTGGALRINYHSVFHYTPKGGSMTSDVAASATRILNDNTGDDISFQDTGKSDGENANFDIYVDMYANNDGTYNAYVDVDGWGAGHLFRVSESNYNDAYDAFEAAFKRVADMLENGWTCGD